MGIVSEKLKRKVSMLNLNKIAVRACELLLNRGNLNDHLKKFVMKNNSIGNDISFSRKQTTHENRRNSDALAMEVHVADVKSYRDCYEHEKVIRQRQDLFDNWEQGNKTSFAKQRYHL